MKWMEVVLKKLLTEKDIKTMFKLVFLSNLGLWYNRWKYVLDFDSIPKFH